MRRGAAVPRLFYLVGGTLHFLRPRVYEAIMPAALPAKRELVYASGAAELVGGAGVLHPRTRRPAGWWLIATLIGIFPANVNMAVNAERFHRIPAPLLWLRLPLQALLIRLGLEGGGPIGARRPGTARPPRPLGGFGVLAALARRDQRRGEDRAEHREARRRP